MGGVDEWEQEREPDDASDKIGDEAGLPPLDLHHEICKGEGNRNLAGSQKQGVDAEVDPHVVDHECNPIED